VQIAVDAAHDFFELGVLPCKRKRAAVVLERVNEIAAPVEDIGHPADRRQVVRRTLQHELQFGFGPLEIAPLDQRSAERHTRGKVSGVSRQTRAAGLLRRLEVAGAAVFLSELCEGDGCWIGFDATSKFGYPRAFWRHEALVYRLDPWPTAPRCGPGSKTVVVVIEP
jgi:hypothetical protein